MGRPLVSMIGLNHHFWLHLLAALFVFRVLAQGLQSVVAVPIIPDFDAWHGGVLPYPILLGSQIIVVVLLYATIRRVRTSTILPRAWKYRAWKYRACFALGSLYFSVMAFRFAAGLTFLADITWFSKSLPAFFHLVLASFTLVLGWHILDRANELDGTKTVGIKDQIEAHG